MNIEKAIIAIGLLCVICCTAVFLKTPAVMWAVAVIPVIIGVMQNQKNEPNEH